MVVVENFVVVTCTSVVAVIAQELSMIIALIL